MFQKVSCPYDFLGILESLHFKHPSTLPQKLKLYDIKSTCIRKKKTKSKLQTLSKTFFSGLVGWDGGALY